MAIFVLLAILISGCTENGNSGYFVKEKQSDIRIVSTNINSDWGFNKGFTAIVTLTLANYGEADGTVVVEYTGDSSGYLGQKNLIVPAKNSIIDTEELDVKVTDNTIRTRLLNQRPVEKM